MIIDYKNIEAKKIEHFKDGEGHILAKLIPYEFGKVMYATLEPGCSIGYHKHETNSEIIYILSGKADILYDDGTEHTEAGGCHVCPKGHAHSLMNNSNEDLVFFAVIPEQ